MSALGDLGQGALALAPYAAAGLASGKARGAQAAEEQGQKQLELLLRRMALELEARQLRETSQYHRDTLAQGDREIAARERYQNRDRKDAERLQNQKTVFDPDFGLLPPSAQSEALRVYGDQNAGKVPYGAYIPPGSKTRYDAPNEAGLQNLLAEVLQGLTRPGDALDRVGQFRGPGTLVPPTAAEEEAARARGEQARVDLTGVKIPISEATQALIESRRAMAAYNRARPEDMARDDRARDAAFQFAKERFGKEFGLAKTRAQQEYVLGQRRDEIAALSIVLELRRLEMQAPLTAAQVEKLKVETARAKTAFDEGTWQRLESLREAGFKLVRTITGKTRLDPATAPLREEYYRLIGLTKAAAEENVQGGGAPPPSYPGLSYPMSPQDPLGGGYPLGDLGTGASGRGEAGTPPGYGSGISIPRGYSPGDPYGPGVPGVGELALGALGRGGPQPGSPLARAGEFLKKPTVNPVGPGGLFGPGRAGGLDDRGNVSLTLTPDAYARVVAVLQGDGKAPPPRARAPVGARAGRTPTGRTPPALPAASPTAPPTADLSRVRTMLQVPGVFETTVNAASGELKQRLLAAYKKITGKPYRGGR